MVGINKVGSGACYGSVKILDGTGAGAAPKWDGSATLLYSKLYSVQYIVQYITISTMYECRIRK